MTDVSRAIVRADYLHAILPFISNEVTRYYLQGVYIEPHPVKGALLVATDGLVMAVIRDIDGVVEGLPKIWAVHDFLKSVKAYTKEKANKLIPGWCHYVSMDMIEPDRRTTKVRVFQHPGGVPDEDEIAHLGAHARELPFDDTEKFVVDGTFPEYRRVVPGHRPERTLRSADAWINPTLMVKCCKFAIAIAAAHGDSAANPVQFLDMGLEEEKNSAGPFVLRISGIENQAFALVMPMRGDTPILDADGNRVEGPPPWFYEQPPPPPKPEVEPEQELEPEIPLVAAQAAAEMEIAA